MKKTTIARSISLMAALLAAQGASASGFQLLEQNASGLANAYAGSAAVADNASTIYFNPAGMTELQAREVSVGLSLIKPSYKFSNNGSTAAPGVPLSGNNGGDAGDIAALPNGYMSFALSKDWYLGVGVGAPFGLKTEYDEGWVGRFQSMTFDIKTYNINPSLAWKVSETVSLGAGLNWQRMEATYDRMAAVSSAALQNTKVTLDASNDAWGWNIGALFKPSQSTKIGVSYRSAIKHELEGDLSFSGTAAGLSPLTTNASAKAELKLPDTAIISVAQQLNQTWEMLGDLSWTGWGKINTVDIVRTSGALSGSTAQTLDAHFKNTWRIALGANQKLNEQWQMKYGIAWDQAPVKGSDSRLVSLPDNDRLWLSLGVTYNLSKASRIDVGGAYLIVKDTEIDNNQISSGRGRVTGTYEGSVAILGLQYSQAF